MPKNKLTISFYDFETEIKAIINNNKPRLIEHNEITNNTTKTLIFSIVLLIKLSIKLLDDYFKANYKLLNKLKLTN